MTPPAREITRQIDMKALTPLLHAAPILTSDVVLDVIFDDSGSCSGFNDTLGLRREVILIVLERLVRKSKGNASWWVRLSSFDTPSSFDLELTRLDRNGLARARKALLSTSPGGSSVLGPSLDRAEQAAAQSTMPRVLVCLTDFELFDQSPQDTLASLIDSTAQVVLAVSLTNEPPRQLVESRVRTAQIRGGDSPAMLANCVIDAVTVCEGVAPPTPPKGTRRGDHAGPGDAADPPRLAAPLSLPKNR